MAKNSVRDTGKELGNTGQNKVKNKRKMNYKEEETVAQKKYVRKLLFEFCLS